MDYYFFKEKPHEPLNNLPWTPGGLVDLSLEILT